ncbi:hypothetical protein BRN58_06060 [Xanthomonas oryzae pv. oryzae]|nr:hypothetical protein BRM78_22435 [Xanthomonas oryzae pv. oryzae]AXM34711.1 hypothetical protein BRM84_00835 [Xanthomonas oryzae pv. oryzae]RBB44141.1 hypothetical protein BRN58_06060 [Xanthomonas oryzae pv. oryzae]RBF34798.1 hypothetical protein BRM87_15320 [Xanthomonas oryzae pv. oryzae]RBI24774.1 hypothetical protein BRM01_13730 [Xanthomonas oryzae pv. oryzae]
MRHVRRTPCCRRSAPADDCSILCQPLQPADPGTGNPQCFPESRIPNPESRIPNPESRIPNPESRIPNPESRIPNPPNNQPQ